MVVPGLAKDETESLRIPLALWNSGLRTVGGGGRVELEGPWKRLPSHLSASLLLFCSNADELGLGQDMRRGANWYCCSPHQE